MEHHVAAFRVGNDGYLMNVGALDLVAAPFEQLVDAVVRRVHDRFNDQVVSLFLRGSLCAGRAFVGTSDADFVVVLGRALSELEVIAAWQAETSVVLCNMHKEVSDVDLAVVARADLLGSVHMGGLRVNLATSSVALLGVSADVYLPRYRPDRELALAVYPDLEGSFESLMQVFRSGLLPSYNGRCRDAAFWCDWAMRTVLRSASLLAMLHTREYIVELRAAWRHAEDVFPALGQWLAYAYMWSRSPSRDLDAVYRFLSGYSRLFTPMWQERVG